MSFAPDIHFQGNCRAAMTAYQGIFGGALQMMPYSDASDGPPETKASDRIMHGALTSSERQTSRRGSTAIGKRR